jgi:hypothetical protein
MVRGLFDAHADVADVVRGLPPDHAHGLTFHLPLEVQALEYAGADPALIADRIDQRLPKAFADSLVDPPLYRWAEGHYRDAGLRLASLDIEQRRRGFEQIVSLGPGLAGAAFHPIIRMAYGSLRGDARELTRGLAYLRTRREVLFAGRPRAVAPGDVVMPSPEDLEGISVFEQIDFVAGEPAFFAGPDEEPKLPEVAALCTKAMGLVRRDPNSFIAIHTVTGLHALAEIAHHLSGRRDLGGVPDDPLLESWWQAMTNAIATCAIVLEATAPASPVKITQFANLESLVGAAIGSPEVHDLKLSVSLSRLVELGIATEGDALEVGATKLAATECSAE